LSAFAVQHSVMARPAFKRWWTQFVSPSIERSIYVLAASLLLFAICVYWKPLPAIVIQTGGVAASMLWALFWTGWLIVLASTFMINHFELFGLRQAWQTLRDRPKTSDPFVERMLYKLVRHPIMLGFLIAFWATPNMTIGHLLFAAVTTVYIIVAIQFEERDLKAAYGAAYEAYQSRVRMLLPLPRGSSSAK
jgi:methanethiol S-methyltransferase